jgi:hypothetical protein
VFDHIDVTFFILEPLLFDGLVMGLDDLDLFYVLLAHSLQSFLQEIPKNEVNNTINEKYNPE